MNRFSSACQPRLAARMELYYTYFSPVPYFPSAVRSPFVMSQQFSSSHYARDDRVSIIVSLFFSRLHGSLYLTPENRYVRHRYVFFSHRCAHFSSCYASILFFRILVFFFPPRTSVRLSGLNLVKRVFYLLHKPLESKEESKQFCSLHVSHLDLI